MGKLIALYDDNHISIDGDTALGFTEDVLMRFHSYGWHTIVVGNGDSDFASIASAIELAKSVTDKPTLIKIRTTIGFGSKLQGEEKCHGAPLGKEDIANIKTKFGFDSAKDFHVDDQVYKFWKGVNEKNAAIEAKWDKLFASYSDEFPQLVNFSLTPFRLLRLREDLMVNCQRI